MSRLHARPRLAMTLRACSRLAIRCGLQCLGFSGDGFLSLASRTDVGDAFGHGRFSAHDWQRSYLRSDFPRICRCPRLATADNAPPPFSRCWRQRYRPRLPSLPEVLEAQESQAVLCGRDRVISTIGFGMEWVPLDEHITANALLCTGYRW